MENDQLGDVHETEDAILTSSFTIKTKPYNVSLDKVSLVWNKPRSTDRTKVPLQQIISVKQAIKDEKHNLEVNYFTIEKNFFWKLRSTAFVCPNNEITEEWHKKLEEHITEAKKVHGMNPPKNLLIFVNPGSGGKKGVSIYEKHAAPIFALAGINTDVIVTTGVNHSREVLADYDLNTIDGIVIVGGDGTYSHCLNGLLRRVAKDAGVDVNDTQVPPVKAPLPIGVIPSGTGEGAVVFATLTKDAVTSTLHICTGYCSSLPVFSVHNGNKLMNYAMMLAGYGNMADSIEYAESHRHLGKIRLTIALFKVFIKQRVFDSKIGLHDVLERNSPKGSQDFSEDVIIDGLVNTTFCFMWPLCFDYIKLAKDLNKPFPDTTNGKIWFYYFMASESRMKIIKHFMKAGLHQEEDVVDGTSEHFGLVTAKRCTMKLREEITQENRLFNLDGELNYLTDCEISISAYDDIFRLYGVGAKKLADEYRRENANKGR